MTFYVAIGCVRFARYCGKMYCHHLFPYSGLQLLTRDFGHVIPDEGANLLFAAASCPGLIALIESVELPV